jgi:hypothetical protein
MIKTVIAGVLTFIASISVVGGGYWCWKNPEPVKSLANSTLDVFIWIGIVLTLPWSSFLFMKPLLAFQNSILGTNTNYAVSIGMLAGYLILDIMAALALHEWESFGPFAWVIVIIGFVAAGVYNFIICESVARYKEGL